jgi:hypothetical protein
MLRFFKVEDRTLKRHISIGVFVVCIDTGSSMPISPSKSRDLADEKKQNFDGMEMIRNNRITLCNVNFSRFHNPSEDT